jgi:hypothetical protein
MEYVWPGRGRLNSQTDDSETVTPTTPNGCPNQQSKPSSSSRSSLDSQTAVIYGNRASTEERRPTLGLPSRRLTSSRSFNDLRSSSREQASKLGAPSSSTALFLKPGPQVPERRGSSNLLDFTAPGRAKSDAVEMRTRSAQKTFVLVQISR